MTFPLLPGAKMRMVSRFTVVSSVSLVYTIATELVNNRQLLFVNGNFYVSTADRLIEIASDFSGQTLTSRNPWEKPNRGNNLNIAPLVGYNDNVYYTTTRASGLAPYSNNVIIIRYDTNAGTWTFLYSGGAATNGIVAFQLKGSNFYFDQLGTVLVRNLSFGAVSSTNTGGAFIQGSGAQGSDGYYGMRTSQVAFSVLPAAFANLAYSVPAIFSNIPYTTGVLGLTSDCVLYHLTQTTATILCPAIPSSTASSHLHFFNGTYFATYKDAANNQYLIYWTPGELAWNSIFILNGANAVFSFAESSGVLYLLFASVATAGASKIYQITTT